MPRLAHFYYYVYTNNKFPFIVTTIDNESWYLHLGFTFGAVDTTDELRNEKAHAIKSSTCTHQILIRCASQT